MPFLYSLAAQVTLHAHPMIRAVALQFPQDPATHNLLDQFLLGPNLLVCPVTHPMYFGPESTPLNGIEETRNIYLPAGQPWFDFWNNTSYPGGQTISAEAPLERIPLYLRAGSILPLGPPRQHVADSPDAPLGVYIYTGADAHFTLYEDDGVTYAYEQGAFSLIEITWQESTQTLTLAARQGTFPELIPTRVFRIHLITPGAVTRQSVTYFGFTLTIRCS